MEPPANTTTMYYLLVLYFFLFFLIYPVPSSSLVGFLVCCVKFFLPHLLLFLRFTLSSPGLLMLTLDGPAPAHRRSQTTPPVLVSSLSVPFLLASRPLSVSARPVSS
jgi:hypothetical protein